jgi:hypothetical protein
MPGSCSSNSLNGCAGCGPSLGLWKVSSQESLEKTHGASCLNNSAQKRYLNSNATYRIQASSDSNCQVDTGTNYNASLLVNYKFYISQYGDILPYQTSDFNYSADLLQVDPCLCYRGTLKARNITKTDAKFNCNNGNPFMQSFENRSCPFNDNWGYSGPPGECGDSYGGYSNNTEYCIGSMSYPSAEDITSCTQAHSQSSSFDRCCGPWESCGIKCNDTFEAQVTLSSELTISNLFNLCKQAVNIKIQNYETNLPYSCNGTKCGTGEKDDCWVGAGSFSIADNNLDDLNAASTTAQKLKFKITAIKEDFDKKYQSVSGKVKFYYGGTDGKTPCCNDDFDGTLVKEAGYSISAGSSTFKNDYLASSIIAEFDNSDQSLVGETIGICYTIDNIQYF